MIQINSSKHTTTKLREIWYKTINWKVHLKQNKALLDAVVEIAKKNEYFECLYVSINDDGKQFQIHAGRHPIPSASTKQRIESEYGATMGIALLPMGDVAVTLYPFESKSAARVKKCIIWHVYKDVTQLTQSELKRAVNDFFVYMTVSSVILQESRCERLRVQYLEQKSRWYEKNSCKFKWSLSGLFRSMLKLKCTV
ncbi:MAG: hypothetical protein HAW67_01470 [Endozoicomonadaceae bacterium]|nr:hypothetical protein [Endozoicomonadaceae bacterium]